MKMGFITSILEDYSYEEMIDVARALDFRCVEVASWPRGKAERRYAGVSHIDAERVNTDDAYAEHVKAYAAANEIEISSLAYYPNTMDHDPDKREAAGSHLKEVIRASRKLEVGMVTTFIGRDQTKTVEENLEEMKSVWPSILEVAEKEDVKVAIENCPMLFGPDQWPGGQNLFSTPERWEKIFSILDSEKLGINYDPSHFVWQMMDYIEPVYEFKNKIFHVHFKDIKILPQKLKRVGITAYPLDFMVPKIPGLGDVNFGKFVSALTDVGYNGYSCIEVEDRSYEGSREKIIESLRQSKKYMDQFVPGV
jgi:sugar phosphate isomerase/epimerase